MIFHVMLYFVIRKLTSVKSSKMNSGSKALMVAKAWVESLIDFTFV